MVVIGGITRLTGSGLSITEWKPIMGAVPPMNDQEWHIAFEKYKQIPQFQKINADFELSDFKNIFWWEWLHRQIGRLIGIVFLFPFLYFFFTKQIKPATTKKMLFLFLLGGIQGFLGWFMVKSGLTERTSVSHIRLAIHLIAAFITFGFTMYYALELKYTKMENIRLNKNGKFLHYLTGFIIIQIVYGAFVAGLHAGKIHMTFPLMSGELIPNGITYQSPVWLNFFDNPIMVQFIHRSFAFTIVFMTAFLFLKMKRETASRYQMKGIYLLLTAVSTQFLLGVFTLLTGANIVLASLHQIGAFLLFTTTVYLLFHFRYKVGEK